MRKLRALWMRLRVMFSDRHADEDFSAELEGHLQMHIDDNLRSGMSPEQARRHALMKLGGMEQIKQQYRERKGLPLLETTSQDLRFGVRQLWNHPSFASTGVLSLALGIGATASVFSVIYGVLVNPYPYRDVDRLVRLGLRDKSGHFDYITLNAQRLHMLQQAHSIESIAAYNEWPLTIKGHDFPETVNAMYFTGGSFQMLGVTPLLGRYLEPSDDPYGEDPQPVAVLSYKFWQSHYNGNSSVIGQTLEIDHKMYAIVGVAQPRFVWLNSDETGVFLPQPLVSGPTVHDSNLVTVKLRPGITRAVADAELQPLFDQLAKENPDGLPKQFKVDLQSFNAWAVEELGTTLYLLLAAVALLLLIGCGNVSILLLARGTTRQHEFAVRSAVGATSSRLVRQLLAEALLLATTGAGLGMLLAYKLPHLIVAWLPEYPHEANIRINLPVLSFCVGLAVLTGVLFGLFPALQFSRPEIGHAMQSGTHKLTGSVRGRRVYSALISGQIALTMLLLTAAGMSSEGFLRIMHSPLGFDPHNVLHISIPPPGHDLTNWKERMNYLDRLREKIAEIPEVVSAGLATTSQPLYHWDWKIELSGKPSLESQQASLNVISAEYFDTLHIPLLKGRLWDHSELISGSRLVVVNQAFVHRYFPNEDVLGRLVRFPDLKNNPPYMLTPSSSNNWLQIVGIVGDVRNDGFMKPSKPAIYVPYSLAVWTGTQMLIRTRVEPLSVLHHIQQELASVNPDQSVATIWSDSLEDSLKEYPEWVRGRMFSVLFAAFSLLALVLASVGLYSVVSYSVAQRTNEFGIRMALGAQKSHVLKIVLVSAGVSVGSGIVAGLVLSFSLNRIISRWMENAGYNPWVILGVCCLLLTTALLACLAPAHRALEVDPMKALRCE
jgi:predicted permease